MMKILIILRNGELNGVTTFNMTLKAELERRGHHCEVVMLDTGTIALHCHYDIVVLNNRVGHRRIIETGITADRCLFFIHSLMNDHSLPFQSYTEGLEIFTFSETGIDFLSKIGYEPKLIRNAIDLNYFKFHDKESDGNLIQVADIRNGYLYVNKFRRVGKSCGFWVRDLTEPTNDMRKLLQEADVVVAYGRHAIEAMAMGKQVIVYGCNGGDGLVTVDNVRELAKTNFSGWSLRTMKKSGELTEFDIVQELFKIRLNDTQAVTKYIRENYNIVNNLDVVLGIRN